MKTRKFSRRSSLAEIKKAADRQPFYADSDSHHGIEDANSGVALKRPAGVRSSMLRNE